VQENAGIENKPRRKRLSLEQIVELVREFKDSGLSQRKFCENRGIALSKLQRSPKIVRRRSEPQLMAVQIEADERSDRALELMVGEGYRIKIGAGFYSTTLRRLELGPVFCYDGPCCGGRHPCLKSKRTI
jgi:hypothetical protein